MAEGNGEEVKAIAITCVAVVKAIEGFYNSYITFTTSLSICDKKTNYYFIEPDYQ